MHSAQVALHRFEAFRRELFGFRYEAGILQQVGLVVAFAGLTGIAAQIRIFLPFSPVPITLQTFAVLLAGVILGMRLGGLSQGLYVGGGLLGMPWFQGFGAGVGHVLGPTGGYIVGFIIAAGVIGLAIDRLPKMRTFWGLIALLTFANVVVIYGLGTTWLFLWGSVVTGGSMTVIDAVVAGVLPFLIGDAVKLVGAAVIGVLLLPSDLPE